MEEGTVPEKGTHRNPGQEQERPEAQDEQPQQETAVGRVVPSHVAGGPGPAQKHGSGHCEKHLTRAQSDSSGAKAQPQSEQAA